MPILNYTTKVPVFRTIEQINKTLAKAGANQIVTEYDNGAPIGISFLIKIDEKHIAFRMPVDINGVKNAMENDTDCQNSYRKNEQYPRVAWRILKDWIEAQLALVEAQQATVPQVFLPYAVSNDGINTVYQRLMKDNYKMLTHKG